MEYQILRTLLIVYELGVFILAITYLRYRRCTLLEYALWGTLAFVLPILGPFFVIAARPGPKKRIKRPALAVGTSTSSKG